ncbi:MAG TPA: type II toxin-antitoxin system VapC family toxin [Casimicrobiaceae bacterium]|nr:type II toxin-antitoxin system VapC family toxin [Casimicrobiaceae bacterium]
MILADVNVLIYAFRSDSDHHEAYRSWLGRVINGPSAYGVSPQVLAAVVRVCTHPRIFKHPSTLDEALAFCKVISEQPGASLIMPGERHWSIFESMCRQSRTTGNLVQDAWFAALAVESGCEWVTVDRDYARFPQLSWRTPF